LRSFATAVISWSRTIAFLARDRLGAVSTQAVYVALTGAGLVRRIEPAGSPVRFESRVGDNHHHLICRACRTVLDVDCAVGHAPCLEPPVAAGWTVDEAESSIGSFAPPAARSR
jgi:Fe2+ or Zn2+ uptake regulation protein